MKKALRIIWPFSGDRLLLSFLTSSPLDKMTQARCEMLGNGLFSLWTNSNWLQESLDIKRDSTSTTTQNSRFVAISKKVCPSRSQNDASSHRTQCFNGRSHPKPEILGHKRMREGKKVSDMLGFEKSPRAILCRRWRSRQWIHLATNLLLSKQDNNATNNIKWAKHLSLWPWNPTLKITHEG